MANLSHNDKLSIKITPLMRGYVFISVIGFYLCIRGYTSS
jgi:hypothetical protein